GPGVDELVDGRVRNDDVRIVAAGDHRADLRVQVANHVFDEEVDPGLVFQDLPDAGFVRVDVLLAGHPVEDPEGDLVQRFRLVAAATGRAGGVGRRAAGRARIAAAAGILVAAAGCRHDGEHQDDGEQHGKQSSLSHAVCNPFQFKIQVSIPV